MKVENGERLSSRLAYGLSLLRPEDSRGLGEALSPEMSQVVARRLEGIKALFHIR